MRTVRDDSTCTSSISRRSFFKFATGMLVALPTVAGGFLVPTKIAYAETESGGEEDGGDALETVTKIVMVSASEVGVVVVDAADGGLTKIAGAKVTVTSRYNGKSLSGTTNSDGEVVFDIRNLAENPDGDNVDELETYAFNGTVTVTANGYREFATALTRIEGGGGMAAPTHNLSDNVPYPRMVSFDEWDILYGKNAFMSTVKNDATHTITIELKELDNASTTVNIKLSEDDSTVLTTSGTPSNGNLTVTMQGKYLLTGNSEVLPMTGTEETLDDDVAYEGFYLEVIQDGSHRYIWPLHLMTYHGEIEETVEQKQTSLKPLNTATTSNTGLNATWPSDLPMVGGGSLKSFMPDCYVNVNLNPWGMLQFTAKTPSWGYKNDNGNGDNPKGWQTYPRKSAVDQYKKAWDKANSAVDASAAKYGESGLLRPMKPAASISATGNFQIVAVAQWDTKKHYFEGILAGQLFINVNTAISWDVWVGCVPLVFTFTLDCTSIISLQGGLYTLPDTSKTAPEIATDPGQWKADFSNTGLIITFNFIPSLSAGVGVTGIASVSFRGKFTFTMVFTFAVAGENKDRKQFGYAFDLSVVLTFFLFTASIPIKNYPYKLFYDSQKGGLLTSQSDGDLLHMAAEDGMADLISKMKIITNALLAHTEEFKTDLTGASELTSQDEGEKTPFSWEDMRLDDIQGTLDDGRVITYSVYRIKPDDELVSAADETVETEAAEEPSATESSTEALETQAEGAVDSETLGETETVAGSEVTMADAAAAAVVASVATEAAGTDGELVAQVVDGDVAATEGAAAAEANLADAAVAQGAQKAAEGQQEPSAETADATEAAEPAKKKSVLRRKPSRHTFTSTRARVASSASGELFAMADENARTILTDPAVAGLGAEGGVRPASDYCIEENVFGDPRVKVVHMHTASSDGAELSATCSFRIGVVSIDGEMRTRIIMTVIDAQSTIIDVSDIIGASRPLDFPIEDVEIDGEDVTHDDLYDYEFDLAFTSSGDADTVHLVVVSGRREAGDSTTFASVATDLVFSYVNFHVEEIVGRIRYMVMALPADKALGADDGKYHTITNVKCATNGTEDSNVILVSYLDGVSDTQEGLFDGDYGIKNTRVSFAIVNQEDEAWVVPDRMQVDDVMGTVENNGIHRLGLAPKIGGVYTLSLTSVDETFFYVLKLDEDTGTFTSIKQAAVLNDTLRMLPWPAQDCFLLSYPKAEYLEQLNAGDDWKDPSKWDRTQWVLQKAVWVESDGTPVLQCTPIGPENFNIVNFGLNNSGTFIFWPQTRSGDDRRIYNVDGTVDTFPDVPLYQLMACRVRNGVFSEPFIAADLPHDLSSLEIVASRDNLAPLEVLSTEPVEPTSADDNVNHAVNIYYTAIPHLKCATAIGCTAPVPFVSPGGKLLFHIAIRNDGNSYLGGCKVQMYVHDYKDGKASEDATIVSGSTGTITFGAKTLVESHYNPVVNGEFQNVEDDFALPPGKRSIYKVYIPIPNDWEGDKYVSFVASDAWVAEGGGLTGMAEEDEIVYKDFVIEPGAYRPHENNATSYAERNRRYMDCIKVSSAVAVGEHMADAPLTYWHEDEEQGNGRSGSSKRGSSKRGSGIPKMGDPFSAGLATGLAAAGAAMAAYGRRRAANEAAEDEDADIES